MTEQKKRASDKLAEALEQAGAPKDMIKRAREGYYDDFRSELADPIRQLVIDAAKCGLVGIATRARKGDFDAEKWESDEWAASDEGQAIFKEFGSVLEQFKGKRHD